MFTDSESNHDEHYYSESMSVSKQEYSESQKNQWT